MRALSISFDIIGRYRAELMGIAMLNVLVLHCLTWTQLHGPVWLVTILNTFGRLIFTEGFLLLSGYGLYYSFRNNNNLGAFYKKRVKRVLVPYWMMTLPFFIFWFVAGQYGFGGLLMRLSTLEFWLNGNYNGMWYVAVLVLLYLCFPLIYNVLRGKLGGGILLLFSIAVITWLFFMNPKYYDMTNIGIVKIPFFIIGVWIGKLADERKRMNAVWIAAMIIIIELLYKYPILSWLNLRESLFRIIGIVVCCVSMKCIIRLPMLHNMLRWIGEYTLEIYILHMFFFAILSEITDNNCLKAGLAVGGAILLCRPAKNGCELVLAECGRITNGILLK